jgi:hypothetical protein
LKSGSGQNLAGGSPGYPEGRIPMADTIYMGGDIVTVNDAPKPESR